MTDQDFMREAIRLAFDGMRQNAGGPFGAVIVREGQIIGKGFNRVIELNDPTAHAEMMAIREACAHLERFELDGCTIYSSCEPCPMCLGAIYWARLDRLVYACRRDDAALIDFDDDHIYRELALPNEERKIPVEELLRSEALAAFEEWHDKTDKTKY